MLVDKTTFNFVCVDICRHIYISKNDTDLEQHCRPCKVRKLIENQDFHLYTEHQPPLGALCLTRECKDGKYIYDIKRYIKNKTGQAVFVDPDRLTRELAYPPTAWKLLEV